MEIGAARLKALGKFIALLEIHFPERHRAREYLSEWGNRTSTEGLVRPRRLTFLSWQVDQAQPFLQRLPEHVDLTDHYAYPVKFVSVRREVKRRRIAPGLPHIGDFKTYVEARVGQGVAAEVAQSEWNGLVMLRAAAAATA